MNPRRILNSTASPCRFASRLELASIFGSRSMPTIRAGRKRSLSILNERPKPQPTSTITGYDASTILDETVEILDCTLQHVFGPDLGAKKPHAEARFRHVEPRQRASCVAESSARIDVSFTCLFATPMFEVPPVLEAESRVDMQATMRKTYT